ncbi:DUF1648 domain-containing protein [Lacticaseibacillus nasuensis]|uniref:DUF1648 domain-containing protein n=1 Tax=Lacticaseibacillus nasuensis TaxID=944671 RepID=UPI0022486932|nr:DUF1648 domain-containing protein [Lacticaseibacillus nasuensis]MCX2454459.1 DUF1648 domain-containing protein [Lacticaseibacillus nasuensis]
MKRFRLYNYGAVVVSVVVTAVLMAAAPAHVVMHFNGAGTADSWSGRAGLLLEPVLLLVLALICDRVALLRRRRVGLESMPTVTFGEWRLVSFIGIVLVVFALLQCDQVGLLR